MLLEPRGTFAYGGASYAYPAARIVYWAGGNPFHHHQDLNRLLRAWRKPDTIVVHDQFWTASAKAADVVLPVTSSLERDDVGYAAQEGVLVAMRKVREPSGQSRHDFRIFAELATRLGVGERFTEGLDEAGWIRRLYDDGRARGEADGIRRPGFDAFWEEGLTDIGEGATPVVMLRAFRDDPGAAPLPPPSGRIELLSATVASYALADCPGARGVARAFGVVGCRGKEGLLHLLTNQPARRLHRQLDHGPHSAAGKIGKREPIRINPNDAARRGIRSGDLVRVHNGRGACLAAAQVTDDVMPGVASMSRGA